VLDVHGDMTLGRCAAAVLSAYPHAQITVLGSSRGRLALALRRLERAAGGEEAAAAGAAISLTTLDGDSAALATRVLPLPAPGGGGFELAIGAMGLAATLPAAFQDTAAPGLGGADTDVSQILTLYGAAVGWSCLLCIAAPHSTSCCRAEYAAGVGCGANM
jgi:threonine dehydrogenase-like Zn-dependent dehydrogenase